MDANGFVPFPHAEPTPEIRERFTARAHREYSGLFDRFKAGEMSERALRDLVQRCRSEGIPVAFAIPPVSPSFRAWFQPTVWERGQAWLDQFAREVGAEVFPAPDILGDPDFVDGHHLLPRGAASYSRWLADTHLRPWLTQRGVIR
jgi:hypothetical protein